MLVGSVQSSPAFVRRREHQVLVVETVGPIDPRHDDLVGRVCPRRRIVRDVHARCDGQVGARAGDAVHDVAALHGIQRPGGDDGEERRAASQVVPPSNERVMYSPCCFVCWLNPTQKAYTLPSLSVRIVQPLVPLMSENAPEDDEVFFCTTCVRQLSPPSVDVAIRLANAVANPHSDRLGSRRSRRTRSPKCGLDCRVVGPDLLLVGEPGATSGSDDDGRLPILLRWKRGDPGRGDVEPRDTRCPPRP